MSLPKLNHYRVNLHILSPVHVGTGQELDPFSYLIKDGSLLLIDLVKWMENYPDKDALYHMMDSDNFSNVRSFVADNFDDESAVRCSIPVDNPKLLQDYKKMIQEKNPRNQVLVSPFMRNEVTMDSYIPGSSIKGALRTAIAGRFVKSAGVTSRDGYRMGYEGKIFGPVNEDSMRWLKISDVSLNGSATVIVEAKEFSLDPEKSLTPKGHMEVALNFCQSGKPVVYPLRLSMASFQLHGKTVDPEFLVDSLYRFYVPKYENEYNTFFYCQRAEKIQQAILPINKTVAGLRTNEALIRIGHFSHVECITLDGVREPKTQFKNGRPLPWGKTRTLANAVYPFGWVKLEFLDLEANSRPDRKWPFSLENSKKITVPDFCPDKSESTVKILPGEYDTVTKVSVPQPPESPLDKLIKELNLIKSNDMGRLGTIIQKIDGLETDVEKAKIAKAIREKIGLKAFKKHKRKTYLLELIAKGESD